LGNHPSRHRKERDDAALLTQEGNSPAPIGYRGEKRFRISETTESLIPTGSSESFVAYKERNFRNVKR